MDETVTRDSEDRIYRSRIERTLFSSAFKPWYTYYKGAVYPVIDKDRNGYESNNFEVNCRGVACFCPLLL